MITGKVLLTFCHLIGHNFAHRVKFRLKWKENNNKIITRDTTQTRTPPRIEEKFDPTLAQWYAGAKTYVIFCCVIFASGDLSYAPTKLNCLERFHTQTQNFYLPFLISAVWFLFRRCSYSSISFSKSSFFISVKISFRKSSAQKSKLSCFSSSSNNVRILEILSSSSNDVCLLRQISLSCSRWLRSSLSSASLIFARKFLHSFLSSSNSISSPNIVNSLKFLKTTFKTPSRSIPKWFFPSSLFNNERASGMLLASSSNPHVSSNCWWSCRLSCRPILESRPLYV